MVPDVPEHLLNLSSKSLKLQTLYQFSRATVTKYHHLVVLSNRISLSHCAERQKSEIKILAELIRSEHYEGEQLLVTCWQSLVFLGLWTHHPNLLSCSYGVLPVCMTVFKFPVFIRTLVILGQMFTLVQFDLISTNHICKDPIS